MSDLNCAPSQPKQPTPPDEPYLEIVQEPQRKYRYRYKSEIKKGSHGSLNGRTPRSSPTVRLRNWNKKAVIRVTLCQVQVAKLDGERDPHFHSLLIRSLGTDKYDPHDFEVSPKNDYTAICQRMVIIHTGQNVAKKVLMEKLSYEYGDQPLDADQKRALKIRIKRASTGINVNQVCLRFEAFVCDEPICRPVYSIPINNSSKLTN